MTAPGVKAFLSKFCDSLGCPFILVGRGRAEAEPTAPPSHHGTYLGSKEAPFRGTGSNLMFFFPYTRYILSPEKEGIGKGHTPTTTQAFLATVTGPSVTHLHPHLVM